MPAGLFGQLLGAQQFMPGRGPGVQGASMGGGILDMLAKSAGGGMANMDGSGDFRGMMQPMQQMGGQPAPMPGGRFNMRGWGGRIRNMGQRGGSVMPHPGTFWRHGNIQMQAPFFSPAPSPGFASFLNAMYGRYGQPSPAYQGFLQALQERRDARMGVPQPPPQGAAEPSAQRRVPSMSAGQRSY